MKRGASEEGREEGREERCSSPNKLLRARTHARRTAPRRTARQRHAPTRHAEPAEGSERAARGRSFGSAAEGDPERILGDPEGGSAFGVASDPAARRTLEPGVLRVQRGASRRTFRNVEPGTTVAGARRGGGAPSVGVTEGVTEGTTRAGGRGRGCARGATRRGAARRGRGARGPLFARGFRRGRRGGNGRGGGGGGERRRTLGRSPLVFFRIENPRVDRARRENRRGVGGGPRAPRGVRPDVRRGGVRGGDRADAQSARRRARGRRRRRRRRRQRPARGGARTPAFGDASAGRGGDGEGEGEPPTRARRGRTASARRRPGRVVRFGVVRIVRLGG